MGRIGGMGIGGRGGGWNGERGIGGKEISRIGRRGEAVVKMGIEEIGLGGSREPQREKGERRCQDGAREGRKWPELRKGGEGMARMERGGRRGENIPTLWMGRRGSGQKVDRHREET